VQDRTKLCYEYSSVLYPMEMSRGKESIPMVGVSGSQGGTVKWPRESGRLSDRQIGITWSQGGEGRYSV
jgi:hypothetical protein